MSAHGDKPALFIPPRAVVKGGTRRPDSHDHRVGEKVHKLDVYRVGPADWRMHVIVPWQDEFPPDYSKRDPAWAFPGFVTEIPGKVKDSKTHKMRKGVVDGFVVGRDDIESGLWPQFTRRQIQRAYMAACVIGHRFGAKEEDPAEGGVCWWTIRHLADPTTTRREELTKDFKTLEMLGFLHIHPGKGSHSTRYYATLPMLREGT